MKMITLTQVKSTIVDDDDFERLGQFKWFVLKDSCNIYAVRRNPEDHGQLLLMHRVVMRTPPDKQTDHINGYGLDNRKENLRICTGAQNQHNSRLRKDSVSGFKGVRWHKDRGRWMVTVTHLGKQHS